MDAPTSGVICAMGASLGLSYVRRQQSSHPYLLPKHPKRSLRLYPALQPSEAEVV